MNIEYHTDTKQIIATNSVFTYNFEPLMIKINNLFNLKINILDEEGKGSLVEWDPQMNSDGVEYLNIKIYNVPFNKQLFLGAPIVVYKNESINKQHYLNLSFYRNTDSVLYQYTIFLDK